MRPASIGRSLAILALLLPLAGVESSCSTSSEEVQTVGPAVGTQAPEIEGDDLDGRALKLSDLRGKVVLLAFWSAADARGPALAQTLRELLGRHAQDPFVVLGVSSDDDAARFREFAKAQDLRWRSLWEGSRLGPVAQSYSVKALPTLFLIDAAGVIRQTWVGPTDAKTLDLRVEPTVAPLRAGR
jgi:peroxiredoxin